MTRSRRLAAVWFADIAGYTELSSRDEEAALSAVDELQRLSREAVEAHGGRIVKFLGDGVLTVFDSADAAVRSAIKLQEGFTVDGCALRIGVHLGEVVEQEDGDLLGDGVNVASRIEGQAQPGQVVVSEQVYQLLKQQADYSFEPFGPVTLRGTKEPMWLYALGGGDADRHLPVAAPVESSWLYGRITTRWPQTATIGAIGVAVVQWVREGLGTDGMLESYLFAWAVATTGLWFIFDKAEVAVAAPVRKKIAAGLVSSDVGAALAGIPEQFTALFDRAFGDKHWSRRRFFRSSVVSVLASVAVLLIGLAFGFRPSIWASYFDPEVRAGLGGWLQLEVAEAVLMYLLVAIVLNVLPDYLSLLESRWAIGLLSPSQSRTTWLAIGCFDLIATTAISFGFIWFVVVIFNGNPLGEIEPLTVVRFENMYSPYFYTAFFTSVWLWLYAASVLVSRVLLRMNSGVGFLLRVTDVEKQPFRSMGFVSVILVSCLFALGLPLVLL